MKFKLIEKEKKGFARYCPTFARAYDCMKEGLQKRTEEGRRIRKLARDLSNDDVNVRIFAARALEKRASDGKDVTAAILVLAKALSDGDAEVRKKVAWVLQHSAGNGAGIVIAIPALTEALDDKDSNIRTYAAVALGCAAEQGGGIIPAIFAIVKLLGDESPFVRPNAANSLERTARHGDQRTRTLIMNEIIGFMRSDWFRAEMEKNSIAYERIAGSVADVLDKIKKAELKGAA